MSTIPEQEAILKKAQDDVQIVLEKLPKLSDSVNAEFQVYVRDTFKRLWDFVGEHFEPESKKLSNEQIEAIGKEYSDYEAKRLSNIASALDDASWLNLDEPFDTENDRYEYQLDISVSRKLREMFGPVGDIFKNAGLFDFDHRFSSWKQENGRTVWSGVIAENSTLKTALKDYKNLITRYKSALRAINQANAQIDSLKNKARWKR